MPNTKEKLIELRREGEEIAENFCFSRQECCQCPYDTPNGCQEGLIADHLIANGVTAIPLKIGDVVYFPVEDYHDSAVIDGIKITAQGVSFTWVQYEVGVDITECWDDGEFDIDEIGKTVFLTRAEAEAHLPQPPKGE